MVQKKRKKCGLCLNGLGKQIHVINSQGVTATNASSDKIDMTDLL